MEDAQIIDLYFRRSEEAIGQTARKYGAYLHQVAHSILRCREDTEEVVEDTYMAAWNAIPPQKPAVLKHFLSKITRNLSLDRLDYILAKKRNPGMTVLLSELDECLPDPRGGVEAAWERRQIGAVLNRYLGTLKERDCAIFLSRYYYVKTTQEISRQYGLSQRSVIYRLQRMRQGLRRELEREGVAV